MDSLLEHDSDLLHPPWSMLGRSFTLGTVSAGAKVLLRLLNTLVVEPSDLARFRDLTMRREEGVGLLTYSNHTSTFDDPGLPSALLPWWMFWGEHLHSKMRWTLCAKDVCFLNDVLRQFFVSGKALPVDRAGGVHQPVIGAAARRLGAGDWLHVFPEGRVQPAGDVGVFRQGIGKLVCDARAASGRDPLVLPFFHSGMARVMPYYGSTPGVGNTVTVVVGQPVDLGHITCRCNQPGEDQHEVWRDIAAVLRESLVRLEGRAPQNQNQLQERPGLLEEMVERSSKSSTDSAAGDAIGCSSSCSSGSGQRAVIKAQHGRWYISEAVATAMKGLSQEQQQRISARCPVLQRPYWAPDQERRQQLWAQGLMRGQRAEHVLLQKHEQQLGPQQHHEQEQVVPGVPGLGQGRLRRLWHWWQRRLQHDGQLLELQQGRGRDGTEQQQGERHGGRWLWSWRRRRCEQPPALEPSASGGHAPPRWGAAAAAQRHVAGAASCAM